MLTGFSLVCFPQMCYVKFFDGMDDEGSELKLCLLYIAFAIRFFFRIPHIKEILDFDMGMLFQILKTVGNSTRTVKME